MFDSVRRFLGLDKPDKIEPFDKILYAREGEEHSAGVIAEAGEYCWERGVVVSVENVSYDKFRRTPIFMDVTVETEDGMKETMMGSCELHYLASYVPAESVDGLEGCVVPVMYSKSSEGDSDGMELDLGDEEDEERCMLSAGGGDLIAKESDFEVHPAEKLE